MYISHFSSSESNAITSKKGEEYQTEQFESTLLKRMTKEERYYKTRQASLHLAKIKFDSCSCTVDFKII